MSGNRVFSHRAGVKITNRRQVYQYYTTISGNRPMIDSRTLVYYYTVSGGFSGGVRTPLQA